MNPPTKSAFDDGMGILNGIIGDYLQQKGNPLATEMGFYHQGQPIVLSAENLKKIHPAPRRKVCVLVHGLTNTESIWRFKETPHLDYGKLLEQDAEFTPLYVRYNSGLAVETNGQLLTCLLESLIQTYPHGIDELILMGFSMGGLLIRSANHMASKSPEKFSWAEKVKRSVYIGTPHQGAALEHLGYWATRATKAVPKEYVQVIGDLLATRSQGIQDMRHGKIAEGGDDILHFSPQQTHYFISGEMIGSNKNHWLSKFLGDGLVNRDSAHARQLIPDGVSGESCHFEGLGHLALARSPKVYTQLKEWLA